MSDERGENLRIAIEKIWENAMNTSAQITRCESHLNAMLSIIQELCQKQGVSVSDFNRVYDLKQKAALQSALSQIEDISPEIAAAQDSRLQSDVSSDDPPRMFPDDEEP